MGEQIANKPKRNWLAIFSLALGIVGLVTWVLPVYGAAVCLVGLFLGVLSMRFSDDDRPNGSVVINSIGLLLVIFYATFSIYIHWQNVGAGTGGVNSINNSQIATTLTTFTNLTSGYNISLPKGWTSNVIAPETKAIVAFSNPATDSQNGKAFAANVVIAYLSASSGGSDLQTATDNTKNSGPKRFKNFSVVGDKSVDLNGSPARILETTFTNKDGVDVSSKQLFTYKNQRVYVVTAIAGKSSWTKYSALFDLVLMSLKVK